MSEVTQEEKDLMPSKEEMLAAIAGEEYVSEDEVTDIEASDGTNDRVETEQQEETSQYIEDFDPENPTDVQKKALEMGWNPLGVEGKEAVGAREYVYAAPIYDRVHKAEKEVKEMKTAFQQFKEMQDKIIEKERKAAQDELKRQMREAVEIGDTETADKLFEKAQELSKPEPVVQNTEHPPEFVQFLADNPWYDINSDQYDYKKAAQANAFADAAAPLVKSGKKSYADLLKEVADEINKPVQNPNRGRASPVTATTPVRKTVQSKQLKDLGLATEELRMARNIMRQAGLSEAEYIEMYNKANS